MHTRLIQNQTSYGLNEEINKIIRDLESLSPLERDFTYVKDVKISIDSIKGFVALIIFDKTV